MGDSACFISAETEELFKVGSFNKTPNLTDSICVVCGDRATGRHYGAISCEGCKGFFKRVARTKPQFKCSNGMKCSVNKETRNCCQYCRWQKCLVNGMRRTLVQNQRIPLETFEQESGMAQMSSSAFFKDGDGFCGTSGESSSGDANSSPECEEMQANNVVDNESWRRTMVTMISLMKGEEDRTISNMFTSIDRDSVVPEESIPFTMVGLPIPEDGVVRMPHVNESAARLLFVTVHWIRSLPTFQVLSPKMQVALLKSSWTQLFTIGLFQCQNVICLSHVMKAIILHYHQHFDRHTESHLIAATGSINKLDQIVKAAQSLKIDDFECAALRCLALFTPAHLDVVEFGTLDVNAVKEIYTSVSWALADYLDGNTFRLSELLLLLPRLQLIDSACLEASFFPNLPKMKLLNAVVPCILNMDSEFKVLINKQ